MWKTLDLDVFDSDELLTIRERRLAETEAPKRKKRRNEDELKRDRDTGRWKKDR